MPFGQCFGHHVASPVDRVQRLKLRKCRSYPPVAQQQVAETQPRGAVFAQRGQAFGTQSLGLRAVACRQRLVDQPVECSRIARRPRTGAVAQDLSQQRQAETCKPVGGAREKRHGAENIARDGAGQKNGRWLERPKLPKEEDENMEPVAAPRLR